jgi:translation initiation factor 1
MSKKETPRFKGGLAYSTNTSLQLDANEHEDLGTLENAKQKLIVKLDNKKRAGKVVTTIDKFVGTDDDLETLAKFIKTKCGTGGSAKDGQIMIQGDVVQKVKDILVKEGYRTN